jgi:hypothetical protein
MPVLFRLPQQVGHLTFDRIEPLVECQDRRLGGCGLGREAGGVGWPAAWLDLPLEVVDLPLQPVDALLRAWRRTLGEGGGREQRKAG